MGKLYKLIENNIKAANEYYKLLKDDYVKASSYKSMDKHAYNIKTIECLLNAINNNSVQVFGSKDAYRAFLANNKALLNDEMFKIPTPVLSDKSLIDYEKVLDLVEATISEEQLQFVVSEFSRIHGRVFAPSLPFIILFSLW